MLPPPVLSRLAEHLPREDLTPRETEVLRMVARGLSNSQIGAVLFCSENTVKAHLKRVLAKLGASDRTEAVTIALRRGIMHLD